MDEVVQKTGGTRKVTIAGESIPRKFNMGSVYYIQNGLVILDEAKYAKLEDSTVPSSLGKQLEQEKGASQVLENDVATLSFHLMERKEK